MALSKEVYKEFADVVGDEFISNDPALWPCYYGVEFSAIVLPKNTAQVQAIVKLCNKHKINFRATCTGWTGTFAPGTLLLDMRRMNRIIEINEKNMYAVVEPYVISAQLQAELFKRGFHCNIKGSGSHCAAMLRGHGSLDQTTSGDDRNHLAIEWVTPEGDLVRSGSLGSTGDWFAGDGPGPSLRSILTSAVPPGVTPGVFTKAALKIYHWPGPNAFASQGVSPRYTLKEVPENMMAAYYTFPSLEKMWDAEIKLGMNEITFMLYGFNLSMVSCNISTSIEAEEDVFNKLNKEATGSYGFFVVIAGNSKVDFEYKKKVLDTIMAEAEGTSIKSLEDPEINGILISNQIRVSGAIRETFRAGGAFKSIPIMGQRDLNIKWAIGAGKAKMPLIKDGYIVDDGGAFFGWGVEQGHLGKVEIFCKYDPRNEVASEHVMKWADEQTDRAFRESYFASTMGASDEIGKALCNYHVYWKKITDSLDPNNVSPDAGSLV